MTRYFRYALVCLVFTVGYSDPVVFAQTGTAQYLTPERGRFDACVVIPQRATELERYAADELAKYMERITGGAIAVAAETAHAPNFGFYIGRTTKALPYAPPQKRPFNGSNGFRIKSIPDGLAIIGGDDLSTLYGVYAFLEEYQGCSWVLPIDIGEIVPANESIVIPGNLDVTQIPSIPVRWLGSDDWGLKNRTNVSVKVHGHDVGVRNGGHFHTWRSLVPPERYYDDHPEYYALTRGDRTMTDSRTHGNQLCSSSPEVIRLVTAQMNDLMSRDPSVTFIALNPNDGGGFCECGRCKAQVIPQWAEDRHGSASGPVHRFNNEVATRFKQFHPDIPIRTGAYASYSRYPTDPAYKPEGNLRIIFTTHIQYCHNHAVTDQSCPYIAESMEDYYTWAGKSSGMHIYAYECLHYWSSLPWPMVHVLKKDMPEYHRTGVEQFYTQTAFQNFSYGLAYFVAARLAWNASADVAQLVRDFCRKSYGAAGPAMERYHMWIEDSWENNPHHVAYNTNPIQYSILELFPPEVVDRADILLRGAETVETDSASKARVQAIRTDFDYLRLVLQYFHAILQPFEETDLDDPQQVETAAAAAASTGGMLAPLIMKYLQEHMPAEVLSEFMLSGARWLVDTHKHTNQMLGILKRQQQNPVD